ncbi:MAG TPA: co-chaperone YbbN, partial [Candidatus Microthrix parvicella]|nr:co-chaperone YbbN [Candidatus Microthrix parvicella]
MMWVPTTPTSEVHPMVDVTDATFETEVLARSEQL